jgi:hypothetical protein
MREANSSVMRLSRSPHRRVRAPGHSFANRKEFITIYGWCVGRVADYSNQSAHLETQRCSDPLQVLREAPVVDDFQALTAHICASLRIG